MALPFFGKKKDKAPPPKPAVARPAPAPAPAETGATETLLTMEMGGSGIVVEEASGAPQSPVDEAAILYASGQADSAEQVLRNILTSGDRRAWHMLFDLFRVRNQEKEFEQLALDYAIHFETSPPVWQSLAPSAPAKQEAQTEDLELPGLLDKNAAATLREGISALPKSATVRVDFSHIEMIDESGAEACTEILAAARKARRKLRVKGVDRLIALLQDLTRATHSRAGHWLLLLELHHTLGQQEAFEDLAVDYAVRFEVSPPSWTPGEAAEVVESAPATPAAPADDALRLSGEITPATDSVLQQLGGYAATHSEVIVDLSQVTRVDYGSVSQFISVLMQCLGSGKSITLRGHNALIHELFRVMGIDQLAQLIPHQPR